MSAPTANDVKHPSALVYGAKVVKNLQSCKFFS